MAQNAEKRKFFQFFKQKNAENIFFTEKSCTFASHLSLGLWCNGNTADSGPAFPGSSPGSPTERFPNGNLFFCTFAVVIASKIEGSVENKIPLWHENHSGITCILRFSSYLKQFSLIISTSSSFGIAPVFTVYRPSIGMKSRVGMPTMLNALAISGSLSTLIL